ncbi:class I SAM-dependent methyltransferase [bacterium]|nr:class I SAM-dependent methyltransferase [bacterium]MBU1614232.1 class I SAM-dependent methyltransferase [bacterium]
MFLKEPIRIVNEIYDYIGQTDDDYVDDYERKANDDLEKRLMPDEVKDVLLNCCQVSIGNIECNEDYTGKICDIGCAYGFILNKIKAKEKVGIDISLAYLKELDDTIAKIRCNAEDIPLSDHYFDVIICTDVFEHVQDELKLSNEIERLLRPGGVLLLATPWEQDLSVYETEEYIQKYKKYKYVHLRSVNDELILRCFSNFNMIASTLITIGMRHMDISPYPLRFMQLQKNY